MYLKGHRCKNKYELSDSYRVYKDNFIVMEDFIISVSAPAIYNRFSRRFRGMVKWFDYTQGKIVKLSKAMKLIMIEKKDQECLDLIEDAIKLSSENKTK